jgi:hypothetical protein
MCSPRAILLSPLSSAPSAAFFFIAGAAVANDESAACASIVVHDVLDTNGAHCAICTEIVSDGALYNTPKPLKAIVFSRHCIPTTVFQH